MRNWIVALLILAACDASHQAHAIKAGWYERADSKAVGGGITAYNMALGETGVRCLCVSGFQGYDEGSVFVITVAPSGYSDTIGRRFRSKAVD